MSTYIGDYYDYVPCADLDANSEITASDAAYVGAGGTMTIEKFLAA